MKKKLVSLVLATITALSLAACGQGASTTKQGVGDTNAKAEVEKSVEGLKALDSTYIISTNVESPIETTSYIEVVGSDFNYTEYPVDSEGNIVQSVDADGVGNSYMLSDWMTDTDFYIYSTDKEGNAGFYSFPKSYRDVCADRTSMYADILVSGSSNFKKKDTITADLGEGDKEFQIYTADVSSDAITKLMRIGSYDLYDCISNEYKDNANMMKYAGFMKDELNFNLVFGGGNITYAVSDGVLRYYTIEIGGLGTRMYITKSVIQASTEVRDKPDFTDSKEYTELLQDVADYCADYDSYDEALASMSQESTELQGLTDSDASKTTEDANTLKEANVIEATSEKTTTEATSKETEKTTEATTDTSTQAESSEGSTEVKTTEASTETTETKTNK